MVLRGKGNAKIHRSTLQASVRLPDYAQIEFPETDHENRRMIKLPNFCHPDRGLLEQYRAAFESGLEML